MKKLFFIGLLMLAFGFSAVGQYYSGGLAYTLPRTNFVIDTTGNIRFQPGDMGFTMQASAFAGSNFNGSSWFGTAISPAFAYNVSSRFRLKAGVSVMQGFGDNYFYYPYSNAGTTTSIFLQGDYILSNKLMLSGAVYKYFSPYNINIDDPNFKSPEGQGYMLNLNYRPSPHFEINASFEYGHGNGYNPFQPHPTYFGSPFQRW